MCTSLIQNVLIFVCEEESIKERIYRNTQLQSNYVNSAKVNNLHSSNIQVHYQFGEKLDILFL